MSIVYSVFMTFVVLFFVPLVLGCFWKNAVRVNGIIYTYLSGFCLLLAIFQLLGPLMIYHSIKVNTQVQIMTVFLAILMMSGFAFNRGNLKQTFVNVAVKVKEYKIQMNKSGLLLIIFAILLLFQVIAMICFDIGAWRSDDFDYVVHSSSAIHDNAFFSTNTVTGGYENAIIKKYALCGIYVFYTYVSCVTHLPVAVVEHTICAVLLLLLSYGALYLISDLLFNDTKSERYVFLILTELLFLYGMYSHYSLSFRLFGVIWQGKAILATVIIPFLISIYPRVLTEKISVQRVLLLMIISLAAVSLTIGGVIVMTIIPGVLTALYLIRTGDWKRSVVCLLAIVLFPLLDVMLYTVVL